MIFIGIGLGIIAIGSFFLSWGTEVDKRNIEKKIRQAKIKRNKKIEEIKHTRLSNISEKRKLNSLKRKEALRVYYDVQINYLEDLKIIFKEHKQLAYNNLKKINANVIKNKAKRYKDEPFTEFRKLKDNLHNGIKDIKYIEQKLNEELNSLYESRKNSLIKINKNGSKKIILEMLEENREKLLLNFKRNSLTDELKFENYTFYLNSNCPKCKIKLNANMKYCLNCGTKRENETDLIFYKKYTDVESCKCKKCNAPLNENFIFCYNCRTPNDPYQFYSLTK